MKMIPFVLIMVITNCIYSQNTNIEIEVAKDIIEHRPIRNGAIRIISYNRYYDDYFTRKLDQNKGIIYDQNTKINPDSIHLTIKERDFLAIEYRKQADEFTWSKDDLNPYQIIPVEEALAFFSQKNNAVIRISKPLFIRNNTIAMVYFDYTPYHDGYSSLSFYKKIKGVWRSWICIRATKQGDRE